MDSIATISELQAQAPRLVREAEKSGAVTIARHGKTVAYLISRERMEAIIESMEIMGNADAMRAVHAYEAGGTILRDVSCLDGDD